MVSSRYAGLLPAAACPSFRPVVLLHMSDSSKPLPTVPGLLIAVIGPPGSGKTRLLAELAAWQRTQGGRIDGFLAGAGEHHRVGEGANSYRLSLLATGEELPWAEKDQSCNPPYRFVPATRQRLHEWAAELPAKSPLVLLDEFGRFEARGEGLMFLWPALLQARPGIVVMAVRAGVAEAIETRLGRRFDLKISADTPEALAELRQACADFGEWTRIGLFGGASGGLEMTLGTVLHASKLPLRGLVMSSLQAGMMVFASLGLLQPGRVIWVPFISAGLKALSPGGSRLRPMLAIAAQGLLFGASVQCLGANLAGFALGGALVGAWAALQGILLQYVLLGGDLFRAYDAVVLWIADKIQVTAPGLPWLIGAWAIFCGLIGLAAALAAWRMRAPPALLRQLIEREQSNPSRAGAGLGRETGSRSRLHRLREFGRWQFWLPLLVVAGVLLASGQSWETVGWLALRFLAVGILLLAAVSLVRPARWAERLRRWGWWGPALALSDAMHRRHVDRPQLPPSSANRP